VSEVADEGLTSEQIARLDAGPRQIEASGDDLVLVVRDEPGVFSRVAGVLTMHGIDVVAASVHSNERGTGLEEFHVNRSRRAQESWNAVIADLHRALDGELDVAAAVDETARRYADRAAQRAMPARRAVHFDNAISAHATVIDVHADDGVGVLFRITAVLARRGLDIQSAKVQTMGGQVVDAFYVRDVDGAKVTDEAALSAIREAVLAALSSEE
jgi:[protein-PII] uridylyltransferase